jgi:hypothetical protein
MSSRPADYQLPSQARSVVMAPNVSYYDATSVTVNSTQLAVQSWMVLPASLGDQLKCGKDATMPCTNAPICLNMI